MKHKSLVLGLVAAVLVGGISWSALASSGVSSGSNYGVLLAAKKGKKGKKKTPAKTPEKTESKETPAPAVSAGAAVSDHGGDFTLKCAPALGDVTLKGNDSDGRKEDARSSCVVSFLYGWMDDFNHKAYPDALMAERLGVAPKAKETTDTKASNGGYKLWMFYFSGDHVLKALGDKYALPRPPTEDEHGPGLRGAPCYTYTLMDYRADKKATTKWIAQWSYNGYAKDNPSCLPKS